MKKQLSIFERYADEYDFITNAAAREPFHAKEVHTLIERFQPTRVLDAGCASGLTTMLFGREGIETVGLDRSVPILKEARRKFSSTTLPISFRRGSFEALPVSLASSFDLVVCLANAISGAGAISNLQKCIRSFRRVLRPGGYLVLQMLNYSSLKEGSVLPIRTTEHAGVYYQRYMIRKGRRLAIHFVRLDTRQQPATMEPFVHEFDNFSPEQMIRTVSQCGFTRIRKHGDLLLSKRFSNRSRDLVITARKPLKL